MKDKYDHVSLTSVKSYQSDTLLIRIGSYDWIIATFDNNTGTVQIHSSYVTCGYNWGSIGNETIKEFFLRADKSYLTEKFSYNHERSFRETFDVDRSIEKIKEYIIEKRKDNYIDREEARKLYEEAKDIDSEYLEHSGHHFIDTIFNNHLLGDFLADLEYEYWVVYSPSSDYLHLKNLIIPRIKEALRQELEKAS